MWIYEWMTTVFVEHPCVSYWFLADKRKAEAEKKFKLQKLVKASGKLVIDRPGAEMEKIQLFYTSKAWAKIILPQKAIICNKTA